MKLSRRLIPMLIVVLLMLPSCRSRKPSSPSLPPGQETERRDRPRTGRGSSERIDPALARKLTAEARRWLGTPYKYGGDTRRGTDCSGLVMSVFRDVAGVKLPRNSAKQQEWCSPVGRSAIAEGDLVFFSSSRSGGRVTHVGLCIGGDDFIHASSSRGVMVSNLNQDYYRSHYHSAGRVASLAVKDSGRHKDRAKENSNDSYKEKTKDRKKEKSKDKSENKKNSGARPVAPATPDHLEMTLDEIIELMQPKVELDTIKAPTPEPVPEPEPKPTPEPAPSDSIRDQVRRAMSVF